MQRMFHSTAALQQLEDVRQNLNESFNHISKKVRISAFRVRSWKNLLIGRPRVKKKKKGNLHWEIFNLKKKNTPENTLLLPKPIFPGVSNPQSPPYLNDHLSKMGLSDDGLQFYLNSGNSSFNFSLQFIGRWRNPLELIFFAGFQKTADI